MPDLGSGPYDDELVATHCPYCALNCGLQLQVQGGRIAKRVSWKESPLTRGALCSKGMTAHEQVHHADRLRRPLVRRGSEFIETSWGEALDRAAEGFLRIAERDGAAANAVLSGGSLTNEKVYLVGKLARLAFGTPHVDYNGRFCMVSAGKANIAAFGADRMMTPLAELENADVAVVVGANLSAAFPVALPKLLDGVRKRGGRVIVVDPRRSRFVKDDDLHLAIRPGTDTTLFNALLVEAMHHGDIAGGFIRDRTSGFEALARSLRSFDVEAAARECDVDADALREAARVIGSTQRCMYLHGRGPEQQVGGVDNVTAIINLGLALGHVGGPGRGIDMLTGQRNGQGGREWGQRCDQLPAGRSIENDEHRDTVAAAWGVSAADLPRAGLTYTEILDAAGEGSIKGLLGICTNMSVSAPDLTRVEQQMAALEHVVIIDPFFSRSARHADVVLPGSTFAEESGTITTLEGRVVRIDQAVEPAAGLDDIAIIRELAGRLGAAEHFAFHQPEQVFEEMRAVSAGGFVDYSGMTYERLRRDDGLFWPCPEPHHRGTPQLYTERFAHADGRARFTAVQATPPVEPVDENRPLVLTTGRELAQFLSGNQTMRIEAQQRLAPVPIVEVHPDTAAQHGLEPDDFVRITSSVGSSVIGWRPNDDLRTDTLFLPYHWPECNRLVAAHLDPISKIPAFKYTAVSIEPVGIESLETIPSVDRLSVHEDVIVST